MRRVIRGTSRLFGGISIAFFFVLFLSVTIQIIMRNLFRSGSVVLEELARYSLVSLVFLMIPVLTLEKKHIVVDVVLMRLSRGMRRIFNLVIQVIGTAFGLFVLYAIFLIMQNNWNVKTPAMRMPNLIFYFPVGFGMAFFAVGSVQEFVDLLIGEGEKK